MWADGFGEYPMAVVVADDAEAMLCRPVSSYCLLRLQCTHCRTQGTQTLMGADWVAVAVSTGNFIERSPEQSGRANRPSLAR